MGGGLESCCVGHVYGADGAVRQHGTIRTVKNPTMTFHEYPLGGSRVVLCGRTDRKTGGDMKLCKDA